MRRAVDGAMSSSSNSSVVKAFSRADLAIKSVPADMGVPQHRFSFSDISKLAPSSPSPVKELPKVILTLFYFFEFKSFV
jgi:hypothetical protein